jgi:hypothetical protein
MCVNLAFNKVILRNIVRLSVGYWILIGLLLISIDYYNNYYTALIIKIKKYNN